MHFDCVITAENWISIWWRNSPLKCAFVISAMSRDSHVKSSVRFNVHTHALIRTMNDFAVARKVRKFNFPRVENNPCLGNWLLNPSRSSGFVLSSLFSYPAIFCANMRVGVPTKEKEEEREESTLPLIRPAARNKIKRILKLARANFLAFPSIIFVSPSRLFPLLYAQHFCLPLALLFPYQWAKPPIGQTAPEYSVMMRRREKKER